MNFRSDNEAPVDPAILDALTKANQGFAEAYAEDPWSKALDEAFSKLFDTDCRVLPIATGTAANCVALSEASPPWGAIICHAAAHIHNDEGGAPEFYTAGGKLLPLPGSEGKLEPELVAETIDSAGAHGVHNVKPSVVSITQATECGTSYRPDEIRALAEVAHDRGLTLHMDGARFANAVAFLGCSPAEASWQAGVDVLSFGASKNGALAAEAIVIFGHPHWLAGMERRRKRGGHLLSKMRYVSAQLLAMLEQERWLSLATRANQQAARLAAGIQLQPQLGLQWPVEANEVFMRGPPQLLRALKARGFEFHLWPGYQDLARLVCSFATDETDVDRFLQTVASELEALSE